MLSFFASEDEKKTLLLKKTLVFFHHLKIFYGDYYHKIIQCTVIFDATFEERYSVAQSVSVHCHVRIFPFFASANGTRLAMRPYRLDEIDSIRSRNQLNRIRVWIARLISPKGGKLQVRIVIETRHDCF